jgi:hypothetical protein
MAGTGQGILNGQMSPFEMEQFMLMQQQLAQPPQQIAQAQPQQALLPGQPATPPQQMPQPQGGFLHRAGNALLSMGDPYGMRDANAMTPEQRSQGIGQALLNMGVGIAGSNARNPIAAIGQGMQYAQYQGQQQGDQRLKGLMYKNQLGKVEGENRTKEYLRSRGKPAWFTGSDQDWVAYTEADPAGAFKAITNPPDAKAYSIDPVTGKTVINQEIFNAELAKRAAGRSSTTILMPPGEKEFDKETGKADAKRFNDIVEAGRDAQEFVANLSAITEVAKTFQPGKEAELKNAIGPYLQALGVDVKDLGAIQSFDSIVSRMAPKMRPPGAGSSSDRDMSLFLSALPQLGRTPEGNATITAVLNGIMEHRVRAAEIANQAMTGQKSRQEANKEIMALPDPLAAWKAARKNVQAAPVAPPPAPTPTTPGNPRMYNPETGRIE